MHKTSFIPKDQSWRGYVGQRKGLRPPNDQRWLANESLQTTGNYPQFGFAPLRTDFKLKGGRSPVIPPSSPASCLHLVCTFLKEYKNHTQARLKCNMLMHTYIIVVISISKTIAPEFLVIKKKQNPKQPQKQH